MNTKNLSYGRQWIDDDDIAEVVKVLKGDWLTQGPTVAAFERSLADYACFRYDMYRIAPNREKVRRAGNN